MSGDTKTGGQAGQESTGSQPQEGTEAAGQESAADKGQAPAAGAATGDSETPEERAARLERELAEVRKEAAGHRKRAGELEKAANAAADAKLTEDERLAKRAAELEAENQQLHARLRSQAIRTATLAAASKLNYRNPDLAYRLLDTAELDFDDEGQPKGVEKMLRELAQREPYLVKAANGADYGGGQRGTTPEAQPSMNELLRAALGKG